jgi:predicted DNA-binding transcriptional regulator AlpA
MGMPFSRAPKSATCTDATMNIATDKGCAIGPYFSVCLSPWVNEPLPAYTELLTAHDVSRLTRRGKCVLAVLTLAGFFPEKRRSRGRGIGWLRSDVERWVQSTESNRHCRRSPEDRFRTAVRYVVRQCRSGTDGSVRACFQFASTGRDGASAVRGYHGRAGVT